MKEPVASMSRVASAAWLAPLVPLVTGAAIMIAAGAPRGRWAVHLASGVIGVPAYFAMRALTGRLHGGAGGRLLATLAGMMLAAIAATLASEGIEGVHRWIRAGPLLLHPSALFSPLLLVLASQQIRRYPRATLLALAA